MVSNVLPGTPNIIFGHDLKPDPNHHTLDERDAHTVDVSVCLTRRRDLPPPHAFHYATERYVQAATPSCGNAGRACKSCRTDRAERQHQHTTAFHRVKNGSSTAKNCHGKAQERSPASQGKGHACALGIRKKHNCADSMGNGARPFLELPSIFSQNMSFPDRR